MNTHAAKERNFKSLANIKGGGWVGAARHSLLASSSLDRDLSPSRLPHIRHAMTVLRRAGGALVAFQSVLQLMFIPHVQPLAI